MKKDRCDGCRGVCPNEAIFIPGLSTEDMRTHADMALKSIAEVGECRQ